MAVDYSHGPARGPGLHGALAGGGGIDHNVPSRRTGATAQRRVAPHGMVVNLVRSGRKQPQRFSASAGGSARHLQAAAARPTQPVGLAAAVVFPGVGAAAKELRTCLRRSGRADSRSVVPDTRGRFRHGFRTVESAR